MTTVEHFWVNDRCTVTQYTVVLDYKTTWPGKRKQLSAVLLNSESPMRRNGQETKEMSKTLLLVQ